MRSCASCVAATILVLSALDWVTEAAARAGACTSACCSRRETARRVTRLASRAGAVAVRSRGGVVLIRRVQARGVGVLAVGSRGIILVPAELIFNLADETHDCVRIVLFFEEVMVLWEGLSPVCGIP